MRKRKAIRVQGVMAFLLMACLASCGEAEPIPNESKTSPEEAVSCEPQETEDKEIELEVYAWQDEEINIMMLAEEYGKRHPGVTVHANFIPIDEYIQKIMILQKQGSPVDCIFTSSATLAGSFLEKGAVKECRDRIMQSEIRTLHADWYEELGESFASYTMPYRMSHWAVFYNKDLFDEKGISYPKEGWTWEDYEKTAVRLSGESGGVKTYGSLSFDPGNSWWRVPARTAGANDPRKPEDLLEFRKAAEWNWRLTYELGAQKPYTEQTGDDALYYDGNFLNGNIGMYFSGDWSVQNLNRKIEEENLDISYDIAPMPHWEGEESYVISDAAAVCMSATTKLEEEAFSFMEFASGEEGAKLLAAHQMIPAVNNDEIKEIYQDAVNEPQHAEYLFEEGRISRIPSDVAYQEAISCVCDEVKRYLLQEQTLEDAFSRAEERLKKLEERRP